MTPHRPNAPQPAPPPPHGSSGHPQQPWLWALALTGQPRALTLHEPSQAHSTSVSAQGTGEYRVPKKESSQGGFLFFIPQSRRTTGLAPSQTPHLGAQSKHGMGHSCLLSHMAGRVHKQILLVLLICYYFPPSFPCRSQGQSHCTVVHNWFFLTWGIRQHLVLSAKFLLGKDSRFF